MEILILVLLYYLSQNPAFAESIQPLMSKIKDSEQMLHFLTDLSKFSDAFCGASNPAPHTASNPASGQKTGENKSSATGKTPSEDTDKSSEECEDKKNPQSPTKGIADEFIQNILESYLKKR